MKKLMVTIVLACVCLFSGVAYADLIAHYKLDGDTQDSSSNANHGIEYGGVSYVDGVFGQAASFDGLDDYIESLRVPSFIMV